MATKPSPFKTADDFNRRLVARFHQQIAEQQRLKLRVCSLLPERLAGQVVHCAIKNKKLLVFTHSPLWASQLRFYQNSLLANMGYAVILESLQIKVIARTAAVPAIRHIQAKIPSAETIAIIEQQSVLVIDKPLQQALLKLSATLKRLSQQAV